MPQRRPQSHPAEKTKSGPAISPSRKSFLKSLLHLFVASLLRLSKIAARKKDNLSSAERASEEREEAEFSARQGSAPKPLPAFPVLPAARCIGKEFPSETAYFGRAAPDAVPERSTCQNRRPTFQ